MDGQRLRVITVYTKTETEKLRECERSGRGSTPRQRKADKTRAVRKALASILPQFVPKASNSLYLYLESSRLLFCGMQLMHSDEYWTPSMAHNYLLGKHW